MPARKQKKSMKPKRQATRKPTGSKSPVHFVDAEVIHLGESASWEVFDDPSPRCYVYTYEFPDPSEPPSAPPARAAEHRRQRPAGSGTKMGRKR